MSDTNFAHSNIQFYSKKRHKRIFSFHKESFNYNNFQLVARFFKKAYLKQAQVHNQMAFIAWLDLQEKIFKTCKFLKIGK